MQIFETNKQLKCYCPRISGGDSGGDKILMDFKMALISYSKY